VKEGESAGTIFPIKYIVKLTPNERASKQLKQWGEKVSCTVELGGERVANGASPIYTKWGKRIEGVSKGILPPKKERKQKKGEKKNHPHRVMAGKESSRWSLSRELPSEGVGTHPLVKKVTS